MDDMLDDARGMMEESDRDRQAMIRAVAESYGTVHGGITLDVGHGGHPAAAKILRRFPEPKDWPPGAQLRCPCGWTGSAPAYLAGHLETARGR